MDELKTNLVINKIQSKDVYDYLAENGRIGLNELYLVENDGNAHLTSVDYDNTEKKLTYTNEDDETEDIITIQAIKNAMYLSTVASDGSYNSLSNKPSINNVTLEGNKTTAQLNISYDDLTNQPTIPQTTSAYSSTDTTMAMTGKGVASALGNYVPKSTTVTGSGALQGGGALSSNQVITHNVAPNNLTPAAVKVAADEYGHVMIGGGLTYEDVQANPATFSLQEDAGNIDGRYGCVACMVSSSVTLHFANLFPEGVMFTLYLINNSTETINITLNVPAWASNTEAVYSGGVNVSNYPAFALPLASGHYNYINFRRFTVEGKHYMFIDGSQYSNDNPLFSS